MPKEEAGQASATAEELAILAARPQRVEVYSLNDKDEKVPRSIRVAPMTYNVCGQVAGQLREIVGSLGLQIRFEDFPNIMADHHAAVRSMVAAATGETEEYLGALDAAQFMKVAVTVFKVNRDFFVRCVGPMAKNLGDMLGVGPITSTSSPNTDTTQ